jgi:peptidoglycan hydrolase-like protein with peptidoglycan-binding domain
MTTYYPKPLEQLMKEVFDTNPALYVGLPSRMGSMPLQTPDPWNDTYIHFNAMLKQAKVRFGDQPGWDAIPEMAGPDPGFRKAKWVYWNVEITEKQLHSLESMPDGIIAQQIRATIKAQQDYMAAQVDDYVSNSLATSNATTDPDYDPEWKGLFNLPTDAASTVADPASIASTAQTATATGIKLSGAGADVDAVTKSIGLQQERFYQQYNSNTKQAMYKTSNTFDLFVHPAVLAKYKNANVLSSTGDRVGKVVDEIRNLDINIVPTFAIDAAYDGASTTTAEHFLTMNTRENFFFQDIVPYTVEGWKEIPTANGIVWKMRAYWKFVCMAKPFKTGTYYKKALAPFTAIPYNA